MSGLVEFSDGTYGFVGDDGWVDEFDVIEMPEVETTPVSGAVFIDATRVIETELPQRIPLVGPPAPADLPVELLERIADAVREWADQ